MATRKCPFCGKYLQASFTECPKCGNILPKSFSAKSFVLVEKEQQVEPLTGEQTEETQHVPMTFNFIKFITGIGAFIALAAIIAGIIYFMHHQASQELPQTETIESVSVDSTAIMPSTTADSVYSPATKLPEKSASESNDDNSSTESENDGSSTSTVEP